MLVMTEAEAATSVRVTFVMENIVLRIVKIVVWSVLLETVGSVANGMTVRVSTT